jgi:hypothetical protein
VQVDSFDRCYNYYALICKQLLGCWSESPWKNGVISGSVAGPTFGLLFRLIAWQNFRLTEGLSFGLSVGLIGGLIGGLGVGSLNHITLVETISWKWSQFWKRAIPGSILGLILGLTFGLISGLIYGPLSALIGWLIFGLVSGLVGGYTGSVKADKVYPNQGIKLSLKNSFIAFLIAWLAISLSVGLSVGLILGLRNGLMGQLAIAWMTGLIIGLNRGGSAVVKHYALRLILWLSGYTPRNFVAFLDHCTKLILLKKVGGGYIFIHRILLEYFADIPSQHTSVRR